MSQWKTSQSRMHLHSWLLSKKHCKNYCKILLLVMNYVLTINGVIYVLHSPIKMTVDGSLINRPRTRPREWPFWSKLLKSSLNRVLRNAPFCSVQLFMTDHRARSKNPCRKSAASSVIPRTQSYFSLFILGSVVDVITQVIYFDSSDSLLVWCLFLILDSFFSYY